MVNQVEVPCCANCLGIELSDPETILRSLPSDYYAAVSKITDILSNIADINRSFDFFTALVRQCRIAGLMAFPQIENRLSRCSKGMAQINKRTIDHLTTVRKEALFELFNISYFKNLDISKYRSGERLVNNISESIQQTVDFVSDWCDQVNAELDYLYKLSRPLRKHYELLQKISRYLPEGVFSIAGIVPATSMRVKKKKSLLKGETYLIFGEEEVIFLPKQAINSVEVLVARKFSYDEIKSITTKKSSIKGRQTIIKFKSGEALITAPPKVLKGITYYFDLIKSEKPLMIGSAKTILKLEAEASDKNEVKRACKKFTDVFNERLFGPVQTPGESSTMSMTDLQSKFKDLKQTSNDIDNRAKNLQINLDDYRHCRSQINENLRNLRENFSRMGGHFTQPRDLDRWRLDQLDSDFEEDENYLRD